MRLTTFVFVLAAACSTCRPPPTTDAETEAEAEYARTCFDTLERLLSGSAVRREGTFIGLGRDMPVAAVDLLYCAELGCDLCFRDRDAELCHSCLDALCPSQFSACNGQGWSDYESSTREPLRYCWDLRLCQERCFAQGSDCRSTCYWTSRPGARLAFWRLRVIQEGLCDSECSEGAGGECEICAHRYEIELSLGQCFEPIADGR